jgi:F0F1-type ATP synthase epsilon subunit
MECRIISPKETRQHQGLSAITLPALSGRMEVLPNHAESFVVLGKGEVVLKGGDKEIVEKVIISKGLFYIKDNRALLILN